MQTLEAPSKILPRPEFKSQYENYIGGKWVAPVDGDYFTNYSPVDNSVISRVPARKPPISISLLMRPQSV